VRHGVAFVSGWGTYRCNVNDHEDGPGDRRGASCTAGSSSLGGIRCSASECAVRGSDGWSGRTHHRHHQRQQRWGWTINLGACTYNFSGANNSSMAGANALPLITSPITINGYSSATLAGNSTTFRIFQVNVPHGNLTLNGVTITGGSSSAGGGIFNDQATLTLNDSVVKGNTAAMGGGGIASGNPSAIPVGTTGTTTIENNSQVNDNSAPTGGGRGILNRSGTLSVISSEVNGNTSANGGGIASGNGNGGAPGASSTLVVTNSNVDHNVATAVSAACCRRHCQRWPGHYHQQRRELQRRNRRHRWWDLQPRHDDRDHHGRGWNSAPSDTSGDLGYGGGIGNGNVGVPGSGVLTVNISNVLGNSARAGAAGSPTAHSGRFNLTEPS